MWNWRMTLCDKLAASGATPLGANTCNNKSRRQKIASCTDKQKVRAREATIGRQWSAVALWCLL